MIKIIKRINLFSKVCGSKKPTWSGQPSSDWIDGYWAGVAHHKKHIDEGIEKMILKWSGINLRVGSSEVLEVLQDIKKINK